MEIHRQMKVINDDICVSMKKWPQVRFILPKSAGEVSLMSKDRDDRSQWSAKRIKQDWLKEADELIKYIVLKGRHYFGKTKTF